MLWIGDADVRSIIPLGKVIDAVEGAFKEHGRKSVQLPREVLLSSEDVGGAQEVMGAAVDPWGLMGIRILAAYPQNPMMGLPAVTSTVILSEYDSGRPLAVIDGPSICVAAAAAASAVATKYLARSDSSVLGVIAPDGAAETLIRAIIQVRPIEEVRFWGAEDPIQRVDGCDVKRVSAPEDCIRGADVVIAALPLGDFVIHDEWIEEGVHLNVIGIEALRKEDIDPVLLERAKVVVEDISHSSHASEAAPPYPWSATQPRDPARSVLYAELGEIVLGMRQGRERGDEITIFISTGTALPDIATANIVYMEAKNRGFGVKLVS